MKLQSCPRLECGKCETPENTITRLDAAIGRLHEYEYLERRLSDHLYWAAVVIKDPDFLAMGKGTSPLMCRAGALAEAAEWMTSRQTEFLPGYVAACQGELENPVRIEELVSHVTTAGPQVMEAIKNSYCAQHWVDGYSLIDNRTVQVPIEFVRRIGGPNGLAAGNRPEEALEHALCEILERRAHITVLRNRMVVPTIDIDTIDNPVIREQIDFVRSKDIEVYVKDLSFGGELPCVGAYFLDPHIPEEFQFHHFFKVGSAFDREEALTRCFTEYTQGRGADEFVTDTQEKRNRVLGDDFRGLKCLGDDCDNYMSAFMFGMVPFGDASFLKEGDVLPFDRGKRYSDFLDDIEGALEIFKKLGKDCVVVDYTDPEIGFPVLEAIVPGYSDVLPYHPPSSTVLFRDFTRNDVMESYRNMETRGENL